MSFDFYKCAAPSRYVVMDAINLKPESNLEKQGAALWLKPIWNEEWRSARLIEEGSQIQMVMMYD